MMDSFMGSVTKRIIFAGKGTQPSFPEQSKVTFHFRTLLCDTEQTVLDDSKKFDAPMQLIVGKKFRLEVWETIVQTMTIGEVSSFIVKKDLVSAYPFVAKTIRESHFKRNAASKTEAKDNSAFEHRCCGSLQDGIGYDDLNKLIQQPQDLEFIIELLSVELPKEYKQDYWQMNEGEKLKAAMCLKEEGNRLYKEGKVEESSEKYAKAIGLVEQLLLREKPGDPEYNDLQSNQIPMLLNYAQCMIQMQRYYEAIEHCTTVLTIDKDNTKALFRRGKAHIRAWNPNEARKDLQNLLSLDTSHSLQNVVDKELKILAEMEREKDHEDKLKLQGKLFR